MKGSTKCPDYVDYSKHDSVYKRHRAEGLPGWNSKEEVAEQILQLTGIFVWAGVPVSGRVLDIGCGAGNLSFWLESLGYEVTGIDVSAVAINWAKEQAILINSQVTFSQVNAAQDVYRAEQPFDIVLDNHCLHCIIGADRQLYLSNIYLSLNPGGIYICNTMCGEVLDPEVQQYFDPETRYYIRNNVITRYIGLPDDILNEIKAAGFDIQYVETTSDAGDGQETMCLIARKQ